MNLTASPVLLMGHRTRWFRSEGEVHVDIQPQSYRWEAPCGAWREAGRDDVYSADASIPRLPHIPDGSVLCERCREVYAAWLIRRMYG